MKTLYNTFIFTNVFQNFLSTPKNLIIAQYLSNFQKKKKTYMHKYISDKTGPKQHQNLAQVFILHTTIILQLFSQ